MPSDEFYARIFRPADSIDLRFKNSEGIIARYIIEDWISHNEPALAIEMLADFLMENDISITPEDSNEFGLLSKQTDSYDRVMNAISSLVVSA